MRAVPSTPRRASTAITATVTAATQPWPPISATKRPPGRGARGDEVLREHAVAAPEVEDALAGARREQLEDRATELGDEGGVARVDGRVPLIGCGRAHRSLRRAARSVSIYETIDLVMRDYRGESGRGAGRGDG